MCELAVEGTQIAVDSWEATQLDYVPTAEVLDHFEHEINEVVCFKRGREHAKLLLVCIKSHATLSL